ncbi:MAG: 2'-deoxycytidine 5'-triphosphate deaminase [Nitrospinota bacterium]
MNKVLPAQDLRNLILNGTIITPNSHLSNNSHAATAGSNATIGSEVTAGSTVSQPASIDLSLGAVAYRLQASFLPQNITVQKGIDDLKMYELPLADGAILERGAIYIIPLQEELRLTDNLSGRTNPKSSIGRLDIFVRVITDYSSRFEEIVPGYSGKLYLEVAPRSFTVRVKAGQKLNQLRLFKDCEKNEIDIKTDRTMSRYIGKTGLQKLNDQHSLLYEGDNPISLDDKYFAEDGLYMRVSLNGDTNNEDIVGYKSKRNSQILDLEKVSHYKINDFWEPLYARDDRKLILEPEEFYIFASKEKIRIPLEYAAEMVEYESGSGELRTHYAGFFDPGFGYGLHGEILGSKAVLEVRPHDVPFIIFDSQVLFKMKYEYMLSLPEISYGSSIGSHYQNQGLTLSKHFSD